LYLKFPEIQVDFRTETPIFEQIVEQIQNLVLSGQFKPGDQLPTVRQLAAELQINFNTVARAYRILDKRQLISTQHGRGTYIWAIPGEEKIRQLRRDSLHEMTRRYLIMAATMGFQADDIRAMIEAQLNESLP
jgi:GntR family transcriptional regulator